MVMNRAEIESGFREFLECLRPGQSVTVLGHSDVDGLASAAILARALHARGFETEADVTRKGESAWSDTTRQRLAGRKPAALVVSDLGSQEDPLLPDLPTLLVDHHKPTGVPPGARLLTAYGEDAPAPAGLLAYWCGGAVDATEGLDWIAAVSLLGDLGEKNGFGEWTSARKKYGFKPLREATTLLNAPRRGASGDATPALQLLLKHDNPGSLLEDPATDELRKAKEEYNAALAAGRRVGPQFHGQTAIVTVSSPCQIHPALAQMWSTRLPKNIVICANRDFLPGRVNFAARTSLDVNLIDFLAQHRPSGAGEGYGRGHDRATGGSLTHEQWLEFLGILS